MFTTSRSSMQACGAAALLALALTGCSGPAASSPSATAPAGGQASDAAKLIAVDALRSPVCLQDAGGKDTWSFQGTINNTDKVDQTYTIALALTTASGGRVIAHELITLDVPAGKSAPVEKKGLDGEKDARCSFTVSKASKK